MSAFRACAVVPTCNHVAALPGVLRALVAASLPVIVVDDGSRPDVGEAIRATCATVDGVEYQRHAFNGGKGFAVMCGLARARERGFTHAIQVDADGQHDLSSLPALVKMSRQNPGAIVSGQPQFDSDIPPVRRFWRQFTNFWVAVNSLSLGMPDAMCGFRAYPVDATFDLVRRFVAGRRMDFDVEVLVCAHWAGFAFASVPVRVTYPKENFSNFEMLRDNVLLSAMQTRLFFGMLLRAPRLVMRKFIPVRPETEGAAHWASMEERGAYWGMRLLAAIYRTLGRTICLAVMVPVVFYFFVTGRQQRVASLDYLSHLSRSQHQYQRPTLWQSYKHFMSFGSAVLDKFAAWTGDVPLEAIDGESLALIDAVSNSERGAFIITAHVGNPEVFRALGVRFGKKAVNVLMHTEHAALMNRLIERFSPQSPVKVIQVTRIGVDTALILSEAIARGEWVVIAGDRVPVDDNGRVVRVPFLGEMAAFPQGPFILGALLKAPAYLMFCVRRNDRFHVRFSKFADPISLPRSDRVSAIERYAARFAEALASQVVEAPLQWFNFYPFWGGDRRSGTSATGIQGDAT